MSGHQKSHATAYVRRKKIAKERALRRDAEWVIEVAAAGAFAICTVDVGRFPGSSRNASGDGPRESAG
jgi:hypothetical protein